MYCRHTHAALNCTDSGGAWVHAGLNRPLFSAGLRTGPHTSGAPTRVQKSYKGQSCLLVKLRKTSKKLVEISMHYVLHKFLMCVNVRKFLTFYSVRSHNACPNRAPTFVNPALHASCCHMLLFLFSYKIRLYFDKLPLYQPCCYIV